MIAVHAAQDGARYERRSSPKGAIMPNKKEYFEMRKIVFALAIAAGLAASMAVPAHALDDCARPDESNLAQHDCYTNRDGTRVHSPSRTIDPNQAPVEPTARCADGSNSYSQHHSGTCSHHGGVARWNK
jgi:hypothetical protein